MGAPHRYRVTLEWTGDDGEGTASYRSYRRDHVVTADGPPPLEGSSDPTFRGDATRWNPEQLLVASLSQCHLLWYLHLAAEAGVVVVGYVDHPEGEMALSADGGGRFTSVTLRPEVTVGPGTDAAEAEALHDRAHELCFIARSVAFSVTHQPSVVVAG